jgi:alkylated DNA nucleotide flippase Atl1
MTPEKPNPYLEATRLVPAGETRTFAELAALAGRPGAARAAGRAIAACAPEAPYPWHRIVASDGSLSPVKNRARIQRDRLRSEGALGAEAERVERRRRRPSTRAPRSSPPAARRAPENFATRLASVDWTRAIESLRSEGLFLAPGLLSDDECRGLAATFADDATFERTIRMDPRGYGVGIYRYFAEPLPEPARSLRAELYQRLRELAAEAPGASTYPPTVEGFWKSCRRNGQVRASSILLHYPEGGVNFPHRDVYGGIWFPYQAVCVLSRRGDEFEGGAFTLYEEEPGGSIRERAYELDAGDVAVFASRGYRKKGDGRERFAELRHGMRAITRGERFALGLVLHLAE